MSDEVVRLLVTAPYDDLYQLMMETWEAANFIESRGETALVTVMDYGLDDLLKAAASLDITVQRIDGAGDDESYELLHTGKLPPWEPMAVKS